MTDRFLASSIDSNRRLCLDRANSYSEIAKSFRANGAEQIAASYQAIANSFAAAADRLSCAAEFVSMTEVIKRVV